MKLLVSKFYDMLQFYPHLPSLNLSSGFILVIGHETWFLCCSHTKRSSNCHLKSNYENKQEVSNTFLILVYTFFLSP